MTQPLTWEEWNRRMGLAPLPRLEPEPPLAERDYNAAVNALTDWMLSQSLTEGQGIIVMTELLGRILAARFLTDRLAGAAGSQATFDAIAESIKLNLMRAAR